MDPDTVLVAAMGVAVFAAPAAVAAYADGRRPWAGLLMLAMAMGLFWYANDLKEPGYSLQTAVEAFYVVIGRISHQLF
ncbi:MAG: hypothetical protein MK160_04240 [Rhodobacteraceae bacterium]|nr:hypothetical protein [Paracoccaceae bacterium]